jgi:transcriptional regulator with XRE-family HTH domain
VPAELWPLPQRVALRGNELGLTQARLAELSGVKQPKISKLLAYKDLHTLDAGFVIRLARALEMSTDELLTGRRPRIVYDAPALSDTPAPSSRIAASNE